MLIDNLIREVVQDSDLPLLRVNWYDSGGGRNGTADHVQWEIGLLPRVKLRLGRLSTSGEQKGVDLRIGLDLVGHARNQAVDQIYLVSGDDDLTEAVEEGNTDEAKKLAGEATKKLDKAASKNVIHKNQAANRKSAIAKKAASL